MSIPFCLRGIAILLALIQRAAALVENRTIDDGDGDEHTHELPVYLPIDRWKHKDCSTCAIHPDESQAHGGSWYAGLYEPDKSQSPLNISFPFEGTALYVYFILAKGQEYPIKQNTLVNFTLDDNPAGNFTHLGEAGKGLQYRALVYNRTGLNQARHNFFIEASGTQSSWFAFDYAVYTYNDTATTADTGNDADHSNSQTGDHDPVPVGAIVGVSIGGVVILGLLVILLRRFKLTRRKTPEWKEQTPAMVPFNLNPQSVTSSTNTRDRVFQLPFDPYTQTGVQVQENHKARGPLLPTADTDQRLVALQQHTMRTQELDASHRLETEPWVNESCDDLPPGYTPAPTRSA